MLLEAWSLLADAVGGVVFSLAVLLEAWFSLADAVGA